MGRPYAGELSTLNETYSWALAAPIDSLVATISASASLPLLGVGSGGSLSAAHLACFLHQRHTGMLARPVTPLEILSSPLHLGSLAVMTLSAGGSNRDIVAAFQGIAEREARRCVVLCLQEGSKLARLARSYRYVELLEFQAPWGKDGFLATNSLLAFAVLLARAYDRASSASETLPRKFDALLEHGSSGRAGWSDIGVHFRPLWDRETLVVLYGPSVSSAAVDLESKFSEAALGTTQLADFRNFAHGRHHWIAKHESRTAVLAIFADDERVLAEKTLALLPQTVPVARIHLPHTGPAAAVAALVAVLHLVGLAGNHRGIDPGRPGVPPFGRRIYGLRMPRARSTYLTSRSAHFVARKLGRDVQSLPALAELRPWQAAQLRFIDGLERAVFGAIVFDYDGTLCDERDRFSGLRDDVVRHLVRLLQAGIVVGVATGRGKSVREDLKRLPERWWKQVYLAYYNGADIAPLTDPAPATSSASHGDHTIRDVAKALSGHPVIRSIATWEARRAQVSVQPTAPANMELTWRIVSQVAQIHGMRAVRSSHSVDLLLPGVSKRSLLNPLRAAIGAGAEVLLIGDRGQWPGNDADLLSGPFSLSVDEVSADPSTCWNLAPPGHRGVQATLAYLGVIRFSKGTFRVQVQRLVNRGSAKARG